MAGMKEERMGKKKRLELIVRVQSPFVACNNVNLTVEIKLNRGGEKRKKKKLRKTHKETHIPNRLLIEK